MHLNSSVVDEDLDSTDPPPNTIMKEIEQDINCDQLLGIDQAIVQSIERLGKNFTSVPYPSLFIE